MFLPVRLLIRRRHVCREAASAAPVRHGTLALVLHRARYDLLAFLRNRQARFFTLILPLLFLVIFVGVFGNDTVVGTGVRARPPVSPSR